MLAAPAGAADTAAEAEMMVFLGDMLGPEQFTVRLIVDLGTLPKMQLELPRMESVMVRTGGRRMPDQVQQCRDGGNIWSGRGDLKATNRNRSFMALL